MDKHAGPICMRTVFQSPGSGQSVPLSGDAKGYNLSNVLNPQESGLKVNQPASFAIRLNGAKGKIDAKVHSPSGAVEECHVSELEPGEQEARRGSQRLPRNVSAHEGQRAFRFPLCGCQTLFINQGVNVCQAQEDTLGFNTPTPPHILYCLLFFRFLLHYIHCDFLSYCNKTIQIFTVLLTL